MTDGGNHFTLQVNVPKGTTATIYIPTKNKSSVMGNGKSADATLTNKGSVVTAAAGEYQFVCKIEA